LNNIKKSAVSRGENIHKKTGQKSCKYGEINKKSYFFVSKGYRESAEFTRGKSADAGRGRQIQTRNWDAERGGGGENNAKLNNSSTEQHLDARFYTKIAITFLLLFALIKCASGVIGKQKPHPL
jgi:hypothetical protein